MSAIDLGLTPPPRTLGSWFAGWFGDDGSRGAVEAHRRPVSARPAAGGCGADAKAARRRPSAPCACPRRPLFGARTAPCELAAQLTAQRQRGRQIERAVAHYVPPHVLDRLMADPDGLGLGGETRDVTVLFADIRGFSALAEALHDDPARLAEIVGGVMSPLTEIVLAHGGSIDKYMGDCIMAFWGAPHETPDHPGDAFDAACAMWAAMEGVNRRLQAEFGATIDLPKIEIGMGLNSGPCMVGNLGSHARFDYSVLGDPVNVASRLEGLCRTYDVPLLLGEETARRLGASADIAEVDRVVLRGRSTPQAVYAWRDPTTEEG